MCLNIPKRVCGTNCPAFQMRSTKTDNNKSVFVESVLLHCCGVQHNINKVIYPFENERQ
jgi:hypothetical protein